MQYFSAIVQEINNYINHNMIKYFESISQNIWIIYQLSTTIICLTVCNLHQNEDMQFAPLKGAKKSVCNLHQNKYLLLMGLLIICNNLLNMRFAQKTANYEKICNYNCCTSSVDFK